jgi:hypothetical protein
VGFLPRKIPRHEHHVEILLQVETPDLLPLGARSPVRDQTDHVVLAQFVQQVLDVGCQSQVVVT